MIVSREKVLFSITFHIIRIEWPTIFRVLAPGLRMSMKIAVFAEVAVAWLKEGHVYIGKEALQLRNRNPLSVCRVKIFFFCFVTEFLLFHRFHWRVCNGWLRLRPWASMAMFMVFWLWAYSLPYKREFKVARKTTPNMIYSVLNLSFELSAFTGQFLNLLPWTRQTWLQYLG